MASKQMVIINGIPHDVLAEERDGLLCVRRPNGVKEYLARRLPDSPLYGTSRAVKLGSFPMRRPAPSCNVCPAPAIHDSAAGYCAEHEAECQKANLKEDLR